MPFPQFAKTTNPSVIEVLRENKALEEAFRERALQFAEQNGGEGYYPSTWGNTTSLAAIGGDDKPTTGQWKKHPRGRGWLPYKNNPLFKEFEAIEVRRKAVPGLPDVVESAMDQDFRHYLGSPRPFIVDDAAYVGFNFQPVDPGYKQPDIAEGEWEEIKASEFHKAMETYNERLEK